MGERPDSLACAMDLLNNEQGFVLGRRYRDASIDSLKDETLRWMREGGSYYLRRNDKGEYTDCRGQALDLSVYTGRWFIPKCLIRTNE